MRVYIFWVVMFCLWFNKLIVGTFWLIINRKKIAESGNLHNHKINELQNNTIAQIQVVQCQLLQEENHIILVFLHSSNKDSNLKLILIIKHHILHIWILLLSCISSNNNNNNSNNNHSCNKNNSNNWFTTQFLNQIMKNNDNNNNMIHINDILAKIKMDIAALITWILLQMAQEE